MKNKTLKAIVAIILIITLTIADFMLLGMNLITYALENVDNSTGNDNVKFAAFFKTGEGVVDQTKYEMTDTEMKLYIQVAVKNEGYFDGIITLGDSNFKFKDQKLAENIGKIEGNTITLNRVRAGNTLEIEIGIEPIISEIYNEEMLNKQSALTLSGNYTNSAEETEWLSAEKKVTLGLIVPSNIDNALQVDVITNRIYQIGEANKRLVQLKINSTIAQNAYPIHSTNLEIELPDSVEIVEVISNGTYATNGESEKQLQVNSDYTWNQTNKKLAVNILNNSKDGKISWKKDCEDTIIVTLILPEDASLGEAEYTINSQVKLFGTEEKTLTKEITYNLSKESDGTIRANIENNEIIYKGKIYSKEEKEYEATTNIEINYDKLIKNTVVQEKSVYRNENEDKEANIEYKTTIVSKTEIEKVLGQEGSLTIKNAAGEEIIKITKDTEADEKGEVLVTYPEGTKEIKVEIENLKDVEGGESTEYTGTTGIIRLKHTKVIKQEEYTREEIKQLKHLVEQVKVTFSIVEYTFERINELKETTSSAVLTVIPQTISAEKSNQMQMAITLKTDKEIYDLYKNPTFVLTMPEGVIIENILNQSISASDGGLTIAKLEKNGTRQIVVEIAGEQQKYITSEINTQINFTANVSLEKLMPNKIDTIKMQYINQGEIFETQSSNINLIASNDKIVTNLKVENYNGLGLNLEKYSDSSNNILGELPIHNKQGFEVPVRYTIINNYNSAITLTGVIVATFTNKDGNQQQLINYADQAITIEAGQMQTITKTLNIPENLYYSETIDVETLAEYAYSGTTYQTHNSIKLITEEKEGIRDISVIEDKIKIETFAQLGNGTGIEENDQVYDEQIIKYIIGVTNVSTAPIYDIKVSNIQENGNIYDLEEVWVTNWVVSDEEFIEHRYAELDTDTRIFEIEALNPGETKELVCRVVAKKNEENSITTANIHLSATNIQTQQVQKISNQVQDSNLKLTNKKALNEEVTMYGGSMLHVLSDVINITNEKIENLSGKIYLSEGISFPDEYRIDANDIYQETLDILENVNYDKEENCINFNITKLEPNQQIKISSLLLIDKIPIQEFSRDVFVYVEINNIVSNDIQIKAKQVETTLSIVQTTNIAEGQKVKDGEKVIITAEIINQGKIDSNVMVEDNIPVGLDINKVLVIKNGETTDKTETLQGNYVIISSDLKSGEKVQVVIETTLDAARTIESELINKIYATPYVGDGVGSNEIIIQIDRTEEQPEENLPEENEPPEKDPPIENEQPGDNENPGENDRPGDNEKPGENDKPGDNDKPGENEQPGDNENPGENEQPGDNENPGENEQPGDNENPGNDNNPDDDNNQGGDNKEDNPITYNISGNVWVDKNNNGSKDENEEIKDVIVKIIDLDNQNIFLKDSSGKQIEVKTNEKGEYKIENLEKGNYSIIFKYDTNTYELKESGFIKDYIIENTNEKLAITDKIVLNENKLIDLQLAKLKEFDLKIDKFISKVIVQTAKDTKTTENLRHQLVRTEVSRKYIVGANVLVEYTMQITNSGEIAGYATEILDYLPNNMKFNSELNKEWYLGTDGNIHNTSLASTIIEPGESKEIKLILIQTLNNENIGVIPNTAEISNMINAKEYKDINLNNNQSKAEIIINPATGRVITYSLIIANAIIIIFVGAYIIKKKVIK